MPHGAAFSGPAVSANSPIFPEAYERSGLKATYNSIGQKTYQDSGTVRTNDRGEYRLFWITPGRYLIAAGTPPGPPTIGSNIANGTVDNFSFTFFPGVPDATRAATIDIAPGGESSADFTVMKQQLFRVRGRVVDAAGLAATSISISFSLQSVTGTSSTFAMGQSYDPTTGDFEVPNVTPGSYMIQVAASSVERASIDVVNANVDNLVFVLGSGANLTGHIRTDTLSQYAGVDRVRVQLRSLTTPLIIGSQPAEADGTFQMESVSPGEYRVVITSVPPELYVKDVRFGSLDMMTQTIRVGEATNIASTLDVVLSPNVSQIDGIVTDDRGLPAQGVTTVLIPDRNREHTELFRSATTDQDGHYSIRGLPPGDFKLFAWEAIESYAYFDLDLLKKYESQGKPIHLTESSRLNIDIPWVR